MMCADLMMRRARLFGPLLASGCEVLISGKGTRRVRLFDGERALVGERHGQTKKGIHGDASFGPTRPYDVSAMTGPYSKVRWRTALAAPASWDRCRIVPSCSSPPWRRRKESVPWEWTWTIRTDCPTGIMRFVFSSEELASLRMVSSVERRAAFCAKEAASKALSALDGTGTSVRYP